MTNKNKSQDSDKKYVTLEDGVDFRTIARVMTSNGYKMNHATARNQLIQALQNLLMEVAQQVKGPKLKGVEIERLLKDQSIHAHLGDILYAAHKGYSYSRSKQMSPPNTETNGFNGKDSNEK